MPKLLRGLKKFYKQKGRGHLPWRKTRDPYKILVSEVMLQQTQVERVIPFYSRFIKQFPTPQRLAQASLSSVLEAWQGLGYNRRAKYLHEAAKILARKGFPETAEEIEKLPGVGRYTARAVLAFAYDRPEVFIETNIRTVFLHHCLSARTLLAERVADAELLPLVDEALRRSRMQPRDFYAALMDYGAFLKQSGVRLNARSAHYVKQKKFEGSARQLRGTIVREVLNAPVTLEKLASTTKRTKAEIVSELNRLAKESLIQKRGDRWTIAS